MSADRLRQAATVLRERAEAATPGPWHVTHDPIGTHVENGDGVGRIAMAVGEDRIGPNAYLVTDAAYIASMHPGVGLALADWLDTAGADLWAHGPMCECAGGCHLCDHVGWMPHARRALRIADLILGGEDQ